MERQIRTNYEVSEIIREIGTDKVRQTLGNLEAETITQRESLAIEREIGDRHGEANSLNNLGIIADTRGDFDESEKIPQGMFSNHERNW